MSVEVQMITTPGAASYEIRFQSLHQRRGMVFPCDSEGTVDLDGLGCPTADA